MYFLLTLPMKNNIKIIKKTHSPCKKNKEPHKTEMGVVRFMNRTEPTVRCVTFIGSVRSQMDGFRSFLLYAKQEKGIKNVRTVTRSIHIFSCLF